MTMPTVAAVMTRYGVQDPALLSDEQIAELITALDTDLPGATQHVAQAAAASARAQGDVTYVGTSPSDMSSKADWSQLVGYLARLFASPYRRIVQEWTHRTYGVDVGFVNCCIVMAQAERIDDAKALALQTNQQLTPDC